MKKKIKQNQKNISYVIDDVSKLTIDGIKLSLTRTCRMDFQSVTGSLIIKQTDSRANLTTGGGFAIDLTSAKCFFLMSLTAI